MSKSANAVPLSADQAGVLRVAGTRVSLDSVVYAFNEGATPEEIAQDFPTLNLPDIYSVLSHYLQSRAEVEQYLEQRRARREGLKEEIEARSGPQGLRERLLARKR